MVQILLIITGVSPRKGYLPKLRQEIPGPRFTQLAAVRQRWHFFFISSRYAERRCVRRNPPRDRPLYDVFLTAVALLIRIIPLIRPLTMRPCEALIRLF